MNHTDLLNPGRFGPDLSRAFCFSSGLWTLQRSGGALTQSWIDFPPPYRDPWRIRVTLSHPGTGLVPKLTSSWVFPITAKGTNVGTSVVAWAARQVGKKSDRPEMI